MVYFVSRKTETHSESFTDATRFGEGSKHADVMLVGQNPGKEEVKQHRPFVGKSDKYLNRVLQENGLDRKKLYLTGVVKEPTPRNRKPTADEIKHCSPSLSAILYWFNSSRPTFMLLSCHA